jgi:uncharacterized protein
VTLSVAITARVSEIDWSALHGDLDAYGVARIPALLSADDAVALRSMYVNAEHFRTRVIMERHGFGRGEYQYFSYPLPPVVAALRETVYPSLATLANRWHERLGDDARFPADHASYLEQCHAASQLRPTPLMLRYREGDYNCLHQDLYGAYVFPFQLVVLLSEPGVDFEGGEFTVVEQRPRLQSRVEVVSLRQGDAAVFAVRQRPVQGTRGSYRVTLRHGVSRVRRGERYTMGVIFHDGA